MRLWRVEVFDGAPVEPQEGIPMEFGSPNIMVGNAGELSDPTVNLVYTRVGLRIEQDEAWLYVLDAQGQNNNFRWMDHLSSVTIDWSGELRIRGMEKRKDGALVSALWIVEPCGPSEEDSELLRQVFGEEGP